MTNERQGARSALLATTHSAVDTVSPARDLRGREAGALIPNRPRRSLMGRLLRVRCGKDRESLEDFLTEALAGVLARDAEFAERWLSGLLRRDPGKVVDVSTQRTFRTADEATRLRRPDLWITTVTGLALLEAKVGAPETPGQLADYRCHLRYSGRRSKEWSALIFLTPNGCAGSTPLGDDGSVISVSESWGSLAGAICATDAPWTLDFQRMLMELNMASEPVSLVSASERLVQVPRLLRALDDALDGPAWRSLRDSKRLSIPRFVGRGITEHGYYGYSGRVAQRSVDVSMGFQLSQTTPDDIPIPDDAGFPVARVDVEARGKDRAWLATKVQALGSEWRSHPASGDARLMRYFIAFAWAPLSRIALADKVLKPGEGLPWFTDRIAEVLRALG